MKVYFNYLGKWQLLDNETDYINGFRVSEFVVLFSTQQSTKHTFDDSGYNLKNNIITIQYNQDKFVTDFSNLLFENLEE